MRKEEGLGRAIRSVGRRQAASSDSGLAIVVALLVTMISFILATAVLAQAIHNVTQAAYLRKRTAAIHAAEAGLSWYANLLGATSIASLTSTSLWDESDGWFTLTASEVASEPDRATFTLRVKYTLGDVCLTEPCSADELDPLIPREPLPQPTIYAIVRSIGTADGVSRALESAVRLHAQVGGAQSTEGILGTSLCFSSGGGLTLEGSIHVLDEPALGWPTGYDLGCMSDNLVLGTGNKMTITGDVLVDDQGFVAANGAQLSISGNLHAEEEILLGNTGKNEEDECGASTMCVNGYAKGYPTVDVGSGAAVLNGIFECEASCPPSTTSFPEWTADRAYWIAAGWQTQNVASGAAALAAMTTANEKTAFLITSSVAPGCDTILSGDYVIAEEVAIVSSCRFEIDTNDSVSGSGKLTLVSSWPGSQPSCDGKRDIVLTNGGTKITVPLRLYTPCQAVLASNSAVALKANVMARFIVLTNPVSLQAMLFDQAPAPGPVSGFRQDIRYVKEILLRDALPT